MNQNIYIFVITLCILLTLTWQGYKYLHFSRGRGVENIRIRNIRMESVASLMQNINIPNKMFVSLNMTRVPGTCSTCT